MVVQLKPPVKRLQLVLEAVQQGAVDLRGHAGIRLLRQGVGDDALVQAAFPGGEEVAPQILRRQVAGQVPQGPHGVLRDQEMAKDAMQ